MKRPSINQKLIQRKNIDLPMKELIALRIEAAQNGFADVKKYIEHLIVNRKKVA
jgi:hypothetical protein